MLKIQQMRLDNSFCRMPEGGAIGVTHRFTISAHNCPILWLVDFRRKLSRGIVNNLNEKEENSGNGCALFCWNVWVCWNTRTRFQVCHCVCMQLLAVIGANLQVHGVHFYWACNQFYACLPSDCHERQFTSLLRSLQSLSLARTLVSHSQSSALSLSVFHSFTLSFSHSLTFSPSLLYSSTLSHTHSGTPSLERCLASLSHRSFIPSQVNSVFIVSTTETLCQT